MKGQKAYPDGFVDTLLDIAGNCCEKCGKAGALSVHHIWPRSGGKILHKLWNCIILCMETCHKSGNYEAKIELFTIHLKHLMTYCQNWGKKPNKEWTRLETGTLPNMDGLRDQMKIEGVNREG